MKYLMNDPRLPPQKDSLTPASFESFLQWLSPDREQAGAEYVDIKRQLVKLFIRKGCAEAEDLAARTLEIAAIAYSKSQNYPSAIRLCCGVAKNLLHEYRRESERKQELPEDDCISAPAILHEDSTEEEDRCLSRCLDRLAVSERELILEYHQFQGHEKIEARKQLAAKHGGLNRLRITAHRIRLKLHDCITGCMQRSAYN